MKKDLSTGTMLFIEVPITAYDIKVERYLLLLTTPNRHEYHDYIKLPSEGFNLLGDSTELKEENLVDVMPKLNSGLYKNFLDPFNYIDQAYYTAIEAFQSLKVSMRLLEGKYAVLFNPKK